MQSFAVLARGAYEETPVQGNGAVVSILGVVLQFYDYIPRTRIDLGRAEQVVIGDFKFTWTATAFTRWDERAGLRRMRYVPN
jgi:hypothetical protein